MLHNDTLTGADLASFAAISLSDGAFNMAGAQCVAALQKDPDCALAYYVQGCICMRNQAYEAAIEKFNLAIEKAIKQDNFYVDAYLQRGIASLSAKNVSDALYDFTQILLLADPTHKTALAEINKILADNNKKTILDAILALPTDSKISLLEQCLDENSVYGKFFRDSSGFNTKKSAAAYIEKIQLALNELKGIKKPAPEVKVEVEKAKASVLPVSFYKKVTISEPGKENATFTNNFFDNTL